MARDAAQASQSSSGPSPTRLLRRQQGRRVRHRPVRARHRVRTAFARIEDLLANVEGLDLTVHGYESVGAINAFLDADPAAATAFSMNYWLLSRL